MFKSNLQKLIKIFESSSLTSIEIASFWGFKKIKLGKKNQSNMQQDISGTNIAPNDQNSPTYPYKSPIMDSSEDLHSKEDNITKGNGTIKILSPLVGTFYIRPKPGSPPFINEGDNIEVGQTLCIVEAMKIFNEIESEYEGKIIKILIEDGTPIEYDQPLMIIKK